MNKLFIGCICSLFLIGCDSKPNTQTTTHQIPLPEATQAPVAATAPSSGSSFAEHAATAAIAGAAAGTAGAVAHRATDHAINKWEARRQFRSRR